MLRLVFFVVGIAFFIFAVTQLILPALFNKPVLGLFRRSRLEKALLLKEQALERREAMKVEVETIEIEKAAKRMRDEAFAQLTGRDEA